MPYINRRDLIVSLAACAALVTGRAHASCDVWRDAIGGTKTKSYQCKVKGGQTLTSTFMRLSDLMFDSAGGAPLPGAIGDIQSLVRGHKIVETPALSTFTRLFEAYSIPFEDSSILINYDMRDGESGGSLTSEGDNSIDVSRWRTLGVWNNAYSQEDLPTFPIPEQLRIADNVTPADEYRSYNAAVFLRYAVRDDFLDLERKKRDYIRLWKKKVNSEITNYDFGQLDLFNELDAGSVEGFFPLVFSPKLSILGCGSPAFGSHYVPPALYVDVMVCRNDGTQTVEIEDMFGDVDQVSKLREYNPSTPSGADRFGFAAVKLAPGESFIVVQRLLFRSPSEVWIGEKKIDQQPAVYGPTHLPKGVVVGGEAVAFEGRSHNALILASYGGENSCPYLESWCPRAQEWIEHGKVLTQCNAAEETGSDTLNFRDLRSRFRLSEREHEDTVLIGAVLNVTYLNGETETFTHQNATVDLSLGECIELKFDLSAEVIAQAKHSSLTLSGYYQKFGTDRVAALATKLAS